MKTKLLFIVILFFCSKSYAQNWGWDDGQRKIRIHFKNDTKKDVWVLLHYLPYTGGETPSEDENRNLWKTNGWFKISKGQSAYIGDTYNKVIYFYGTTSTDFFGNYREWKGDYGWYFNGKLYGFRRIEMAESEIKQEDFSSVADYTLRLVK